MTPANWTPAEWLSLLLALAVLGAAAGARRRVMGAVGAFCVVALGGIGEQLPQTVSDFSEGIRAHLGAQS